MKKLFCIVGLSLLFVSCMTTTKTAKTADLSASLLSATVADLEVSPERITFTTTPDIAVSRGGLENVKQAATQQALLENGNADVLVDANYSVTTTRFLIFNWVSSVTVTGHPATYKNFRSLNDSVWCNPAFQYNYRNSTKQSVGVFGGFLK